MQFFMAFIVSSMIINNILSDTTKEPTSTKDSLNLTRSVKDLTTSHSIGSNPRLNSLWVYQPATYQSHISSDVGSKRAVVKPAQSLTRLAKSLKLGFDPFFSKGYFEPFEKRPKPVTLVAFRKNGLLPKTRTNVAESKSAEIAELQSPFNDVSNFWVDD